MVWFNVVIVVCNIVGARHNNHRFRTEVDDVGRKPHQHMRRGLPTDASSAEMMLSEEVGMVISPVVGNGIPHEDYLGVVFTGDNPFIVSLITVKSEPIFL